MGWLGDAMGVAGAVFDPVGLIGTGLAMGGDLLGMVGANADRQAARDMNSQNVANADAINQAQIALAQQNIQMEKDFAQNGISWRIADAARNGIAPLAALGASEPGYSPVNAVMTQPSLSPVSSGGIWNAGGRVLSDFGQNVSRALLTTKSPAERQSQALDLAYKSKQNDLLDVQIANAKLNLVKQSASPGVPSAYRSVMNADGTTSVIPSEDAARASHGESFGPLLWSLHNGIIPNFQNAIEATDRPDYRGWRMLQMKDE